MHACCLSLAHEVRVGSTLPSWPHSSGLLYMSVCLSVCLSVCPVCGLCCRWVQNFFGVPSQSRDVRKWQARKRTIHTRRNFISNNISYLHQGLSECGACYVCGSSGHCSTRQPTLCCFLPPHLDQPP